MSSVSGLPTVWSLHLENFEFPPNNFERGDREKDGKEDEANVFVLFYHGTHHFLDDVDLVEFTVSREHWLAVDEFAHNAADGPHIDRGGVIRSANKG
jgi:hypothetical protein